MIITIDLTATDMLVLFALYRLRLHDIDDGIASANRLELMTSRSKSAVNKSIRKLAAYKLVDEGFDYELKKSHIACINHSGTMLVQQLTEGIK